MSAVHDLTVGDVAKTRRLRAARVAALAAPYEDVGLCPVQAAP